MSEENRDKLSRFEDREELSEHDKAFQVIEEAAKAGDTILIVGHGADDTSGLFKEVACILADNKETHLYRIGDEGLMDEHVREVDCGLREPFASGSAVTIENVSKVGISFAMNTWRDGVQGLGVLRFLDGYGADALEEFICRYMSAKGLDGSHYDAVRKEVCSTIDLIVTMYGNGTIMEISKPIGNTECVGAKRDIVYYHPKSEYAEILAWEERKSKEEPEVKHNLDKEKVMERLSMELEALKVKTNQSQLEDRPQMAFVTDA